MEDVTLQLYLKSIVKMEYSITNYCNIKDNKLMYNGKELYRAEDDLGFLDFIKGAYKHLELKYPKFYKMDTLCKLALVGSSVIFDYYEGEIDENTAVILTNRSSCIDIDKKHQSNIDEGGIEGARPANFVYTLPNIALGEISIKYQLRSENSFFIFDDFTPNFLIEYSKSLIDLKKCKTLLCGWVEVNEDSYNGFLFMIEQKEGMALTSEKLLELI